MIVTVFFSSLICISVPCGTSIIPSGKLPETTFSPSEAKVVMPQNSIEIIVITAIKILNLSDITIYLRRIVRYQLLYFN